MDLNSPITRIDIGLSKEDQDRIAQLRESAKPKKRAGFKPLAQLNAFAQSLTRITLRDKVMFFQLLAVMINAGMPLIRSLYVLSEQSKNPKFKLVIQSLARTMEEGTSFSEALEAFPQVFSRSERGMIASGEASGNLDRILKDIAGQAEKSEAVFSKVKGAMIYPAAILTIMALAVVLILTLVIPKLTVLFSDSGQGLPFATKALMWMSKLAQNYWSLLVFLALALIGGFVFVRRTEKGRYTIDWALLHIPILGPLLGKVMLSRFTRNLASLMDAGLPIVKGLEINADAIGNDVYRKRIQFAAQDVAQGIPLGENLSNDPLFPPMVASMVSVGEQTANLTVVCNKVADYYESEVDEAVKSLSKLMEPVILVVMGGMVGFIVAAIMQPIIQLSDVASLL